VRALDLEVARGEILGLLGPNGAGKTTTIGMACGVVTPSRGTVRICGEATRAARHKLGLVPQELALFEELSAEQNLRYFGALYDLRGAALRERLGWALEVVGLQQRARDAVRTYSGGMKRRLNIAAGLLHRPELLVLDEPTVGVDPQSRNHIFETVRALHAAGTTVIYTSHYLEEIDELCTRVAIMDGGELRAVGTVAELVARHTARGVAIEVSGDADAAARAAAGHAEVTRDGAVLHVVPAGGLGPVIAAIEAAGAAIARIESRAASLEAAFLALTGHALRDEP
jgi:ABC-2 type transport system ATP-binding protein